jgi:hypothetical protein
MSVLQRRCSRGPYEPTTERVLSVAFVAGRTQETVMRSRGAPGSVRATWSNSRDHDDGVVPSLEAHFASASALVETRRSGARCLILERLDVAACDRPPFRPWPRQLCSRCPRDSAFAWICRHGWRAGNEPTTPIRSDSGHSLHTCAGSSIPLPRTSPRRSPSDWKGVCPRSADPLWTRDLDNYLFPIARSLPPQYVSMWGTKARGPLRPADMEPPAIQLRRPEHRIL